ncbi:MAG: hypothetical protein HY321_22870 [Armatimonadetes bacterium]|nr:hypothetical protein [Armatimonadota bacterium]
MTSVCSRLLVTASVPLFLSVAQAATEDLGNGFFRHGMASPVSGSSGVVATVDGDGRNVALVWLHDHRGTYALLVVDAETGKSEEIPLPFRPGGHIFASLFSSDQKLYAHVNDRFVQFDPRKRAFTFSQETASQVVMSMTEDDNGVIWSVTLPDSGVLSFNPTTRELRDYGSVYPQGWRQYPSYVATDDTGWLYFGLGIYASQIVAFDPRTGKGSPILAEEERGKGTAHVYRDQNGKVYGAPLTSANDSWFELYRGEGRKIGKLGQKREKRIITGNQGLFHRDFPDGKRLVSCDTRERLLVVEDRRTGETRRLHFDYSSEGAYIMAVAAAPNGTLCGVTSAPKPRTFFSYDPRADRWWTKNAAFGQWNTMARQGDRFYVGTYSQGALLEWNPSAPWVDTVEGNEASNPRLLKGCLPIIGRPHDVLAHPDGKSIILAGTPGYGYAGGGLLFWDRTTGAGTLLPHTDVLPGHATYSLVALPEGKLLGGTTTNPGTGTSEQQPKAAELYLMDMATKRVEWHEAVLPGAQQYSDMCLGPDGLVYGLTGKTQFFVFDPARKRILHRQDLLPEYGRAIWHQGPRVFLLGPKQEIYMLLVRGIAQVEPGTFRIKMVAESPVPISSGGDVLDGRIYFTSASYLCSYRL